ncbi:mannose-6-phosphate isomerase, type 2 (plasmid) [Ilyobacter polytropus DSM 2926]|uniref:Mannose-6-phosphate isomerase, type 2 n=1 Tax=Ilyobacter polytropus (strain ATCC 51220 / DSM 2926 / LMG 16218 / CuHBu1) TaxID=572544 RepID=E3HE03_ILYPC|nr:glycosyltransferase family 4 protein [Ilyobacter polytropus]ADO84615.1 mannose-6-phosphate isomerase, type 2 [Ilyobacter polytropus DSM 2926]
MNKNRRSDEIQKKTPLRVALISPIAWRTPPRHYGPWESVVSLLCEGLVKRGVDVTLFATGESITEGELRSVCQVGYEEDKNIDPKVWEGLHIANVFQSADEFDIIHNNFDFLPLTYSGLVETPVLTTIHGFSSEKILPVYEKYNKRTYYVSISNSDRNSGLNYIGTVHHGIDLNQFTYRELPEDYLLFFGRLHRDKGPKEAIETAKRSNKKLIMAGIIQDEGYFKDEVEPHLNEQITYIGSVGPEERDKLLGGALALLHPIYFQEPFGLSVVEAMACGTPVIAYNKGSMPELIEDGVNGFIVNDVDGALRALENISSIDRKRCREIVEEKFSVDRMVDKYIKVYEKILEERGGNM